MQRYQYQTVGSKEWSTTTVLCVTALVAVTVGATAGLVAGNAASTTLYAPTSVQSSTISTNAIPVTRRGTQARAERVVVEPVQETEQTIYEIPQATFNWAPVAALIALPTAIAAFLLRKAQQAPVATAGLAASALLTSSAMAPAPAMATEKLNGLVPCAESKKFQKTLKKEVKALEKREKLYEEGSEPFLALEATKARTEARFAKYAKAGLLCGEDGLPHLISDPGLAVKYGHAGETLIPTFGFLYIAGYIGTTGRTYLQEISKRQKPTQSEIIIDVPLALSIAVKSWDWPGKALNELVTGKLLEKEENIPVSRR